VTDIIETSDKLACARRELALRERNYPNWIEQDRISAGRATHEIECMKAIVEDYNKLVDLEERIRPPNAASPDLAANFVARLCAAAMEVELDISKK
jgi:hypothetical protein